MCTDEVTQPSGATRPRSTQQTNGAVRRMLPGTQPAVRLSDRESVERRLLIREVLRGRWTRDELNAMLASIKEFSATANGAADNVAAILKTQGHLRLSEKVQQQPREVRLAIAMWAADMWRTNELGTWKLELADLARGTTGRSLRRVAPNK